MALRMRIKSGSPIGGTVARPSMPPCKIITQIRPVGLPFAKPDTGIPARKSEAAPALSKLRRFIINLDIVQPH